MGVFYLVKVAQFNCCSQKWDVLESSEAIEDKTKARNLTHNTLALKLKSNP